MVCQYDSPIDILHKGARLPAAVITFTRCACCIMSVSLYLKSPAYMEPIYLSALIFIKM